MVSFGFIFPLPEIYPMNAFKAQPIEKKFFLSVDDEIEQNHALVGAKDPRLQRNRTKLGTPKREVQARRNWTGGYNEIDHNIKGSSAKKNWTGATKKHSRATEIVRGLKQRIEHILLGVRKNAKQQFLDMSFRIGTVGV